MTTICWDGKVLAADTCMTHGGRKVNFPGKLRRLQNGNIVGVCGDLTACIELMDWLDTEETDPPRIKGDAEALVITDEGEVLLYDEEGIPIELDETMYAIGSGGDYALGAMLNGASAERAVEIAISRDSGSGFGVICIAHAPKPPKAP